MQTIDFHPETYLELAKTKGYAAALSALHRQIEIWEVQTFEGRQGWDPDAWKKLHEIRDFHRSLYSAAIEKEAKYTPSSPYKLV
jgi:hypothetical protein